MRTSNTLPSLLACTYSGSRQKTARWLGTQVQITEKLEKFRSGELFGFRDFCVQILIAPTRRSGSPYINRCGGFLLQIEPFWGWGMIWGKCNEFQPQARSVVGKTWGFDQGS